MMSVLKLYHNTVMINFSTGEEMLNSTPDELKQCGIVKYIPTGDAIEDQKGLLDYEEKLKENRDSITKYTLATAMNQLFDITEIPTNTDFGLYADTLKNIRIAKQENIDFIEITKDEFEKLKKLFSKPPKNPQFNRFTAFVLECLEKSYAETLI